MKIELNALQIGLITSILREFGTTTTMNLRGYILGQQDALWQDTALVAKCCKGKCPADDGPEVMIIKFHQCFTAGHKYEPGYSYSQDEPPQQTFTRLRGSL